MKYCNIPVKNKFFLAPMAKVTNLPFRLLCREYGSSLAFTEFVSSAGLSRENQKSFRIIEENEKDHPLGIQLFGSNIDELVKAAKLVENNCEIIDLNFGCPAPKVVNNECGSKLLETPEKITKIIKAIKREVSIPVTAKVRLGFNENNILKIIKAVEDGKADAIAIHPRTTKQAYSGKADWDQIRIAKENISIPIVGNGGINSPEKAKQMLKETKCDFVMIGRRTMNYPLIFEQCVNYFETGSYEKETEELKIKIFERYYKLCKNTNVLNIVDLKNKALGFLRGVKGASRKRSEITNSKEIKDVLRIVKS